MISINELYREVGSLSNNVDGLRQYVAMSNNAGKYIDTKYIDTNISGTKYKIYTNQNNNQIQYGIWSYPDNTGTFATIFPHAVEFGKQVISELKQHGVKQISAEFPTYLYSITSFDGYPSGPYDVDSLLSNGNDIATRFFTSVMFHYNATAASSQTFGKANFTLHTNLYVIE